LVQLNANISPSIRNYYLDSITIIKLFFQCDRVFPRFSSCLLMSYTIITELVLTNMDQMNQIAMKKKIYFSDTRSRKTLRNKNLSGKLLRFRHSRRSRGCSRLNKKKKDVHTFMLFE